VDDVFRAMADPTRRALLDELFREDGQSLSALEGRFGMTRFPDNNTLSIPFDPASLGFSPTFLNAIAFKKFPDVRVRGYDQNAAQTLGATGTNSTGSPRDINWKSTSANGAFSKFVGTHTFKAGADFRKIAVDYYSPGVGAGFFEFVGMGLMHIFTGIDHMSFLLGLVLICRRLRDLVFVVSGFTIGHSLTLALAVTGVIRPHAEYIDALVALTIVLIGAENVAEQTRKPGPVAAFLGGALGLMALGSCFGFGDLPSLLFLGGGLFTANYLMITGALADAGKFRTMITMVFGLIHGFGFASNLLQMQLPTNRLAELLVGFNLGVEIAQLTLVLGVTALAALLTRFVLTVPRPIVVDVASSFLVGLGTYWFITRSYG